MEAFLRDTPPLREVPPAPVFHYTTSAAFHAVLKTSSLRLTNAAYLNDPAELQYPMDLAVPILFDVAESQGDQRTRHCLEIAGAWLHSHLAFKAWYLISFSDRPDSLGLWRAYCPAGGYALGFNGQGLASWATAAELLLGQVIYERQTQEAIVKREITRSLDARLRLLQDENFQRYDAAQFDRCHSTALFLTLARLMLYFKSPPFHEELEWRMVGYNALAPSRDEYVDRSGLLTPFMTVAEPSERLPLASILVNPLLDGPLALHTAQMLLKSVGYENADTLVHPSAYALR